MRAREAKNYKKGDKIFLKQWGMGIVTVENVSLRKDCPDPIYDITCIDRFGKKHTYTHLYFMRG
jgi:hypothetical protein